MSETIGQRFIDSQGEVWELTARRYNDHCYLVHSESGIGTYVAQRDLAKEWEELQTEEV